MSTSLWNSSDLFIRRNMPGWPFWTNIRHWLMRTIPLIVVIFLLTKIDRKIRNWGWFLNKICLWSVNWFATVTLICFLAILFRSNSLHSWNFEVKVNSSSLKSWKDLKWNCYCEIVRRINRAAVTVIFVLLVALGRTSGTVTVKRVNLSSLCECLL